MRRAGLREAARTSNIYVDAKLGRCLLDIDAFFRSFAPRPSTACPQRAVHNCRFHLTSPCLRLWSGRPVRRGCSSRGIVRAGRDAASRAFAYASKPREAPETEPSAITSGREELADGEAFLLHPAPDRSPKSRGGAPRGERPASWDVGRLAAPAGLRHWPADGCRCTRAPVGAPLPHYVW